MGTQNRTTLPALPGVYYNASDTAPPAGTIAAGFIISGEGDKTLTRVSITVNLPDSSSVNILDASIGQIYPIANTSVDFIDSVTFASIVYIYA
jgi:hypothetical protein